MILKLLSPFLSSRYPNESQEARNEQPRRRRKRHGTHDTFKAPDSRVTIKCRSRSQSRSSKAHNHAVVATAEIRDLNTIAKRIGQGREGRVWDGIGDRTTRFTSHPSSLTSTVDQVIRTLKKGRSPLVETGKIQCAELQALTRERVNRIDGCIHSTRRGTTRVTVQDKRFVSTATTEVETGREAVHTLASLTDHVDGVTVIAVARIATAGFTAGAEYIATGTRRCKCEAEIALQTVAVKVS